MGYELLPALCSASCDITREIGGTIYYGHRVLGLAIIHTRDRKLRLVAGIGFSILRYHIRDRDTICDGHWVLCLVISNTKHGSRFVNGLGLHLVISHTKLGVRLVTGIGFCIL